MGEDYAACVATMLAAPATWATAAVAPGLTDLH